MRSSDPPAGGREPPALRRRWIAWRNHVLASPRFQRWAAAFPLTRPVARKRATALFDLVAGFTYSQILFAAVESGLIERLRDGPASTDELLGLADLPEDALDRLLRGAAAIGLVETLGDTHWVLAPQGAALSTNDGALAMIRHHALLYADLADPLALLSANRTKPTALGRFWAYAGSDSPGAEDDKAVTPYSALMAASQPMVAEQALAAYRFARHRRLLDIGGGHGAFLAAVGGAHPGLALGLFDLPAVVERARARLAEAGLADRLTVHPGSFESDALPTGYDCISLVRILHDHDDPVVARLLAKARDALASGGRLVIVEPMARTPGAEAMGDGYFGFYLWAMGSGRPRTTNEIGAMLDAAGFSSWRERRTPQPMIARVIVASA